MIYQLKAQKPELLIGVGLWGCLLLCVWIYWPGLPGAFLVDDNNTLLALNRNGGVTSLANLMSFVFSSESGTLGRPLAMLSFLINDQYYPGGVEGYRYTNLMIHCLCGVMFFVLSAKLLVIIGFEKNKAVIISLLAMLWWLLTPMNVSTTLYVVQRMTQLSSLFTLIGLAFYLYGRQQMILHRTKGLVYLLLGLYGFGLLAVLSKENGALIFIYAAACELLIATKLRQRSDTWVVAAIALPIIILIAYFLVISNRILWDYQFRAFSLTERLLTESRILVDYLFKGLFSYTRSMGLMQDDIKLSTSLLSPWTTAISLLFHVSVICAAIKWRKRYPLFLFMVAWFYGGHVLESTFIPLELYFEHRNYLPLMAVFLVVVAILSQWRVGYVVIGILLIVAGFMGANRAELWGNPDRQLVFWAKQHPESMRAQTSYAKYLTKRGEYGLAHQQLVAIKGRWQSAFHINLIILNHKCQELVQIKGSYDQLIADIDSAVYTSQVGSELENTVELYNQGRCEGLTSETMHKLLNSMTEKEGFPGKVRASAAFRDAELYIEERNLNGAITALDSSYKYYHDSIPLYVAAITLSEAGLFEDAKGYIVRAIEEESSKPQYKQKNLQSYHRVKEAITNSM